MRIEPYLDFHGHCDEAIEFYKKAVGAEVVMLMRFKEGPQGQGSDCMAKDWGDKVMHSTLNIGGATIMATDGRGPDKLDFGGIMLSLAVDSDEQAKKVFDALSQGGKVSMPISKTFFASSFGMLDDKFGVHWMIICGAK